MLTYAHFWIVVCSIKYDVTLNENNILCLLPNYILAQDATAENGPWLFTLDIPSYLPVMQHAEDRSLREKMYRAYLTKASSLMEGTDEKAEGGPKPYAATKDNEPIIREVLKLRREKAQLIGFKNYAEVSLSSKMATPETALKLLEDLRKASYEAGKKELAEVKEFAKAKGFTEEMKQWDSSYWGEKLKEERYAFNEEELKPYFSLPKVQAGLWSLANRLFGITVFCYSVFEMKEVFTYCL